MKRTKKIKTTQNRKTGVEYESGLAEIWDVLQKIKHAIPSTSKRICPSDINKLLFHLYLFLKTKDREIVAISTQILCYVFKRLREQRHIAS